LKLELAYTGSDVVAAAAFPFTLQYIVCELVLTISAYWRFLTVVVASKVVEVVVDTLYDLVVVENDENTKLPDTSLRFAALIVPKPTKKNANAPNSTTISELFFIVVN
jgi:hypothetical protein